MRKGCTVFKKGFAGFSLQASESGRAMVGVTRLIRMASPVLLRAIQLAATLAKQGRRVCLVDAGGQWCMLPFLFLCPFCSCDCVALKLRSLCNHPPRLRRFAVIEYKPTFSVSCCLLWSPVPSGCMRASLQIRGKITFIRVDRISSQL